MSVMSSYLYFNVVSTNDNGDRKGNRRTHRNAAACRTLTMNNLRVRSKVLDKYGA